MYSLLIPFIVGVPTLEPLLSPTQAIELVYVDLANLHPYQRKYTRYLYDSKGGVEWVKSQSANLNRISRSYEIYRPVPLANNRLLRVDLSQLVFNEKDLTVFLEVWENLRFDPTFNLLFTKELFENILALSEESQPIAVIKDNKSFIPVKFKALNQQVEVIRITTLPINLLIETDSAAPIVESHYFESRASTSIKDKGAFAVIWGGLYYDFNGIVESKDQKAQTDEDLLFESLGVGKKGEKAQAIYDKRRSEQRVAMFRSDVTGKPRQIDFLPTLNRRIGDGPSGVSVTHDVRDQDIQTIHHSLMSLRKETFEDSAREVIFIKANGFNGYALFNNKGVLQNEVPFDVANDTTIPNPQTKRLQSGISCIGCHEAVNHSGWIPVRNDVMTLLEKGIDIFSDTSQLNRPIFDVLKDLGSQYKGRPDKFLQIARNGYQAAVLESTGLWWSTPTQVVTETAKYLQTSYNTYNFERVTASIALKELGFQSIPDENANEFLAKLLKPDVSSIVHGVLPEDVRIFALTHDIPIYRKDFSMIFSFALTRAEQQLKRHQP